MELLKIQESTMEVAEAIRAVLDVDVTIVDKDMYRVAATGRYKDEIGKKLPRNCSFEMIAEKMAPEFIDNPNVSQKCMECSVKGTCKEMATIGYPIIHEGQLLGVIGVIAFTEEQKNNIYRNYESLVLFLDKLGYLLVKNLSYIENISKLIIQDKMTNMIINEIDSGVILIDSRGRIKMINSKVEVYLKRGRKNLVNESIRKVIPNIDLELQNEYYVEKKIKAGDKMKSFMMKNTPVIVEGKKVSNIIELNKTSNMIRDAYRLIEGNKNINFDHIIGNSHKLLSVKELSNSVAASDSTVLIRGESGTGKELFARAIHNNSGKSNAPFIAINCASIPDNLLESELFGYDDGAFTGAKKGGQIGKFELAHGGSLFLDEIGDLPLHLQPKILRSLQEKSFRRVGGKELISLKFRLIAATNRDLEDMVSNKKFRQDLYYRLNVIPINIPPLRERIDDIEPLNKYFLKRHCNRLEVPIKSFSKRGEEALKNYNWPGNIRELENVIEYLVNIIKDDEIRYRDLPDNIREFSFKKDKSRKEDSLKDLMESYEKQVLTNFINKYGSTKKNKEEICKILKIDLSTLYRKLNKYNLQ